MKKIVWDDGLAAIAQSWANNCVFQHNTQRSAQSTYDYVGENFLAYWGAISLSPSDVVANWASQSTNYNPDTFGCYNGINCLIYKQLIWAETEKLGCAQSSCSGVTFIVCNYAPGSYVDAQAYVSGSACSQCPGGYTCDNGLCSK